jgi:hypothetical protein
MSKRNRDKRIKSKAQSDPLFDRPAFGVYGPGETIDKLDVQRIDDRHPTQFGTKLPDNELFQKFSMGPWHELRRQMTLFTMHVRPPDGEEISPRRDPGPEIDERCDTWIVILMQGREKGLLMPPPKDLRKWLYVRGFMALSYIDYEMRNQDKLQPPDLRNKFGSEMGRRLVDFWDQMGKKRWIENDPGRTSTAE